MNAELLDAYAALRKHEAKCLLCSNAGYEHLCTVRRPLWEAMIAVKLDAGKERP